MITNNYLLAFNTLGLLWLMASAIGIMFLIRFRGNRPYWWLLTLNCFFALGPIILLAANKHFPLSRDSYLLHLIVVLVVSCLIALYFHTLDLLNVKVSAVKVFCFFGLALLFMVPEELLPTNIATFEDAIRTIAFHSSCVLLLILSAQNLNRVQKKTNYLQIQLAKNFLLIIAILFSCRLLYGIFNPQYLIINPHEKVDFVFFLIRILMIFFAGLSIVFLISMQKYHLIRINPLNKYASTSEYDVSTVLEERDELINSLLKTNKTLAVGAISTGLAHELNQPLSALNIHIGLLKKELENMAPGRQVDPSTLEDIQQSIDRATNIIRTVSNLSNQVDDDKEEKRASVNKVFDEILKITNHTLQANQIKIRLSTEDRQVAISKTELEQVVLNVFTNAINALKKLQGDASKEITVKATISQNNYVLTISNNGGIIPSQTAENLFQLLAPSTSKGSGIGLWISKYILEKNLADISYSAIEPDTSCFTIDLPLANNHKA